MVLVEDVLTRKRERERERVRARERARKSERKNHRERRCAVRVKSCGLAK